MTAQPKIDTSPKVSDEIRKTTCYMCACRCGINVHLKEGKVAYIEGNRDHPVNKGVLCAKGSAGIMQVNAPRACARLSNASVLAALVNSRKSRGKRRSRWQRHGSNPCATPPQKSSRFLPGATNPNPLPAIGPKCLARRISPPTAVFVR